MNKLRAWYANLQPRERRIVNVGTIVLLALLLIGGLIVPLDSAVATANAKTRARSADLAWMRVNAPELQAGGASLVADTNEAPVVVVDRVGREAGLGTALRGTQPTANGVRVQLEAAPFDTLITWLANLDQRYGLAIESISLDRSASPGVVNANITFAQARR